MVNVFLHNALSSLLEITDSTSPPVIEHLAAIEGYIEKGQFKLALNSLAEAGRKAAPRAKFWDSLSGAAGKLELRELASEFQFLWAESASKSLERELNKK